MFWTAYARMTDEDLRVYAFLRTVPPVKNTVVRFESKAQ